MKLLTLPLLGAGAIHSASLAAVQAQAKRWERDEDAKALNLQKVESDIATSVMKYFPDKTSDSPILIMHDSFVVIEKHRELLSDLMTYHMKPDQVQKHLV